MSLTMQIYNTFVCPSTNSLMDLGEITRQWKDLYVDGLAYIDGLGEDLDLGDFDLTSVDNLYGFDSSIYIDLGTDSQLNLVADGSINLTTSTINLLGEVIISGVLTCESNLDISEKNIITDIGTGTKIGTATTQKLGFWGVTPVVQPSKITDPTESGGSLETAVEAIIDALEAVGILASA